MRTLSVATDSNEIRELLSKYQFEMFNKANKFQGELTTLDENDINAILGDMNMGSLSAIVKIGNTGIVYVEYPNDVCRLESRDLINEL